MKNILWIDTLLCAFPTPFLNNSHVDMAKFVDSQKVVA
jgi:hypothetical protein